MQKTDDLDKATYYLRLLLGDDEMTDIARQQYLDKLEQIQRATPALKSNNNRDWYFGASPSDSAWNYFKHRMIASGKDFLMSGLDATSTQIVNLTPNPIRDQSSYRGLVVGNVQSGKTNSFTAVAAKLADKKYQMVIVLAGIHNSLRNQTQKRLEKFLFNDDKWFKITDEHNDFNHVTLKDAENDDADVQENASAAATFLATPNKTSLIVAKKNATVLKKLRKWLAAPNAQVRLQNSWVLVIDDEADQASVESKTINPLIQEILKLLPRSTYIGYTATPFANVFIDPRNTEDLYPRDFIYSLPKGDGYFGAEQLFGIRSVHEGDESHDGFDMVRTVTTDEEVLLRPQGPDEVATFQATMTPSLRKCFTWFVLATAARRARDDFGHSSMLAHTSFQTDIHRSFKERLFDPFVENFKALVDANDPQLRAELAAQWSEETEKVKAEFWGRQQQTFDEVWQQVSGVLIDLEVIEDNYKSEVRLSYEGETGKVVLAIGGNTLSRGLTLEGLVASLFIRPSKTYDTLLQMGRWFGYRPGYEDLPRIWTTKELQRDFRHLSLVEKEMRDDIESYRLSGLTPREMAVKIRTHDSLRITSKMGAAMPAEVSYAGSAIETTVFDHDDATVRANFDLGLALINKVARYRRPRPLGDTTTSDNELIGKKGVIFQDVRQDDILEFIGEYEFSKHDSAFDVDLINKFINKQMERTDVGITKWNVVVRQGTGRKLGTGYDLALPELANLTLSIRNPLNDDKDGVIDIYSLRPSADYLIEIDDSIKKSASPAQLKRMRAEREETKGKGLLILYPIDNEGTYTIGKSQDPDNPMRVDMKSYNLPMPLLGFTIIFPEIEGEDGNKQSSVRVTHRSVQYLLPLGSEEIDTYEEIHGADE